MTVLLGSALPGGALLVAVGYKLVEAIRIVHRVNAPLKAERRRIMRELREIRARYEKR
jgi:hypothetical protein